MTALGMKGCAEGSCPFSINLLQQSLHLTKNRKQAMAATALFIFIIMTRWETLVLKKYFGSYRGTDIPSGNTICNNPKVKNPILKAYKARKVARPSFLPKPWCTLPLTPFLLTSACLPGTVLLLFPVTGAPEGSWERPQLPNMRKLSASGPCPTSSTDRILHPPAADSCTQKTARSC